MAAGTHARGKDAECIQSASDMKETGTDFLKNNIFLVLRALLKASLVAGILSSRF